jgi:anti-sigma regulatory factor (Ser/Thr protein kinase)
MIQNPRLARTVGRVLRAIGVRTSGADSDGDPGARIERSSPDLLVYDLDSETPESKAMLARMSKWEDAPSLILLSESGGVPMLRDLVAYPSGYNLVLKKGLIGDGDLLVTARKLINRDIFGVDKYLRWGSVINSCQVQSSSEKNEVISRIERFLEELECERRYAVDLMTVMDEFFTNAFFHGPMSEDSPEHSNLPRNQVITLPTWRRPTIEYGSDGRFVAIACRDPFGSLDTKSMLEHLATFIEKQQAEIFEGPGGAGIGLYMSYRSVDHLVINVEEGAATEFIGIVDVSIPYSAHVRQPRTLNVFTLSGFSD